jgi:ribonuclease P protein component
MPAQAPSGRVGYVVSRKVLGRAVDRNRLKRRLRAFLRSAGPDVRAFDLVVRVERPVPPDALDEVFREASALIVKVVKAGATTAARS